MEKLPEENRDRSSYGHTSQDPLWKHLQSIKWNILHNNRIPASRSPNFFTWTNFQRIYTRVLGWDFHLHQDYILANIIKDLTSYLHQILKNLSRKQYNWKTIIIEASSLRAYPPSLYLNDSILDPSQQGRTGWKLYLTTNHLLLTTYNNFRCNWLQYYPSQVDQNTRIYDANGLLLSNLQYGQISINLLHHVHLMEINPDHNPLSNIYIT